MRPGTWTRRAVLPALVAAAVVPAAPTSAMSGMTSSTARTAEVSLQSLAFAPARVTVLTGDTVEWSDISRPHTVTARDGSFSRTMSAGDTYSREFDSAGVVHYFCQIHPFMVGEVDVFDLLLSQPTAPAAPNRPYPLRGRAALAEGSAVRIEGDSGDGFQPVALALVGADGTFVANVSPRTTTTYRAVSDSMTSPTARLTVVDRRVVLSRVRRGGRDNLTVRVLPASPGATVVLQLYLRERFGWWPERQVRLGRSSTAHFSLVNNRRVSARAALTLPDGATQLALSKSVRIGPR